MKSFIALFLIGLSAVGTQSATAGTYTSYLNDASNAIAQAYDASAGKTHNLLGGALKAFNKKSTSVPGDYAIFVTISTRLLPLFGQPGVEGVATALSNAFDNFLAEGNAEFAGLSSRLDAVTPFHPSARAASNQLVQAERSLLKPTQTTNLVEGMLAVRQAFVKLTAADKLITKAEAQPGLARESLAGLTLNHKGGGETGTVTFTDQTNYGGSDGFGTYTYNRTGLNTATLVMRANDGGTTTVKITYTTASSGRFTFRLVSPGDNGSGSGTFTLSL